MDRSKSVVTPQRFAAGMTFDEYVRYIGTPRNLEREGSGGGARRDWSGYFREYAAMYEKDRIRAHQNALRPGETAEQARARSEREFLGLQQSPFFQVWRSAAIDTMLSLLHERLAVGSPP